MWKNFSQNVASRSPTSRSASGVVNSGSRMRINSVAGIVNLFALMQAQGEGAASQRFLALGGQGRSRDFLLEVKSVLHFLTIAGRGKPMPRGRKCWEMGP
jgi:hypothetical protein